MKKHGARTELFILIVFAAVLALMMAFHLWILSDYTENLLSLQENHLLATAKTVANSLQQHYSSELENFNLYFQGTTDAQQLSQYVAGYSDVVTAAVLDDQGNLLCLEGQDHTQTMAQLLSQLDPTQTDARLLPPVQWESGYFLQVMVKPIQWEGTAGWVCAGIDTEEVYQSIAQPVKIGQEGYSMVKQWDGTILMHPSKEQIGIDAIEGRLERFQDLSLDLTDLENLVEEQRENQEGSRVLSSYWWEDGTDPIQTKKLVAYCQIPVGEEIWIVNCTLAYDEVILPLNRMQLFLSGISILSLLAFAAVVVAVLQTKSRRETMELEMKHLIELHAKDEQLRHKDKIHSLGTMASAVSHEFRNFLTPILLYAEILLCDESLSGDVRDMITEIQSAAGQAKSLTEELSQYAHSGQGGKDTVPILVTEKTQRALFWVQKTIPEQITLVSKLDPSDGLCLMGPQGMLRQIIVNLCNNAVQAIGAQHGTLKVTGTLRREEKRYEIAVWDDGPIIPKKIQQEIFTPFFSTKKAGEGTGLGLPIVQKLISEVGGEIHLRSEEGFGTEFTVILPLTEDKTNE